MSSNIHIERMWIGWNRILMDERELERGEKVAKNVRVKRMRIE